MKTINNLKQYIPVLTISLVLIASAIDTDAQNRRNETKKDRELKEYRKTDRHEQKTAKNDWKDRKDENWEHRNYERDDHRKEYHPKYSKNKKYIHPSYFDHPKYGRVYNKFDRNPLVFKHQQGDYYYYENNFYRYHKGIGYCVIESPRHLYFKHLPVDCSRVRLNGHVFFRHGDVFFQLSPRGYVIVPSPLDVRFTARF